MSSSSPSPLPFAPDHPWPYSLPDALRFTLSEPLAQALAGSAANCFFRCRDEGGERWVEVNEDEERAWGLLPVEWRAFFEEVEEGERERMLVDLSRGKRADFPPSLNSFLHSCSSLSLSRVCSPRPVLSFPPSPPASAEEEGSEPPPWPPVREEEREIGAREKGRNEKNARKAGMGPKKEHEVAQLSRLVQDLLDESPLTHCVDVGSGRAHLSRALACPPLNLHVLAIDWSSSQKSGAERLDAIRSSAQLGPTTGSLTHEVSSLDAEGVQAALGRWPPPPAEGEEAEPALLVALHACGDLTPAALEAFVRADKEDAERRKGARAIFVGCCYNLQTPLLFPLSSTVRSLLPSLSLSPAPMSLAHLRLTPQSPPTWHASPSDSAAFRASTLKIAYRARFEAELAAAGVGVEHERRVGRIPEIKLYPDYRAKALERYDYGRTVVGEEDVPPLRFGRPGTDEGAEWSRALWMLRVFWTIRSWLGPPLESLCVVDRFAYLCEGLADEWTGADAGERRRRKVEVVNVFEQSTGSLRNLALVVR